MSSLAPCSSRFPRRLRWTGRVLDTTADFFAREGFSYAVVEAFGLHAYGLTRATHDLDFVTEAESQPRLIPFLESTGYETLAWILQPPSPGS